MAKSREERALETLNNLITQQEEKRIRETEKAFEGLIGKERELKQEIDKIKAEYEQIRRISQSELNLNNNITRTIKERLRYYTDQKTALLEIGRVQSQLGQDSSLEQTRKDLAYIEDNIRELKRSALELELVNEDSEVQKLIRINELELNFAKEKALQEIQLSKQTEEEKAKARIETEKKFRDRSLQYRREIEQGTTEEAREAIEADKEKKRKERLEEMFGTSNIGPKEVLSSMFSSASSQGGPMGGIASLYSTLSGGGGLGGPPSSGGIDSVIGDNPTPTDAALGEALKAIPGADMAVEIAKAINDILGPLLEGMDKSLDKAVEGSVKYMGVIDTRLQGLDNRDNALEKIGKVASNLLSGDLMGLLGKEETGKFYQQFLGAVMKDGNSVLINQNKWVENIASLVDRGVAQEVEGQALIATLSDKIVTTFDVLSEDLRRLIRLQQSNITASQAGVESGITQFLNTTFANTEYLGTSGGSGVYDSVKSGIMDALSQMNVDQATSFEFAVQKWLGSLYTLGASQSTISTLASGLNLLSTGNINELAGKTSTQTLFALAAERAGISYADILTGGLDADTVDALMKSMVNYLGEIANNTSNQVLRSEWSNILGISISDLRAIQNLTQNESLLNSILSVENVDRSKAESLFLNQLGQISSRTTLSEMTSNFMENLSFTFGSSLLQNTTAYMGYKLGRMIDDGGEQLGKIFNSKLIPTVIGAVGKLLSFGAALPASLATAGAALDMAGGAIDLFNPSSLTPLFGGTKGFSIDAVKLLLGDRFFDEVSSEYEGLKPGIVLDTSKLIDSLGKEYGSDLANEISAAVSEEESQKEAAVQQKSLSVSAIERSSEQTMQSFNEYTRSVESQAQSVIQVTEEETDILQKLYTSLFESEKAIKVRLSDIDQKALEILIPYLISKEDLENLKDDVNAHDLSTSVSIRDYIAQHF